MKLNLNNTLTNVIIFVAGAAVGSAVTYKIVKTKYERIVQEEIDDVKATYANREIDIKTNILENADNVEDTQSTEEERSEYESIIEKANYLGYTTEKLSGEKEEPDMVKPYVISPGEVGECDYPVMSLTYYEGDGVLTNDYDEIIDNVDELVGEDFADHFGEYEDDSVFVRNDKRKVDYEILLDNRAYSDVLKSKPYLKED